jgi:hypothetical protein
MALSVAALAGAAVLFAGCGGGGGNDTTSTTTATAGAGGGSATATAGVYVAPVQGTDDSLALVTDGARLTGAYLCIRDVVGQWIRPAPLQSGGAPLIARRGTNLGNANFSGDSASGNVTAGGGPRPYTATLAKGDAGLYRTTTGTANQPGATETGWIKLPDGNVCGNTNSVTAGGGFTSKPAPSSPQGKITNFANPFQF